MKIVKSEVRSTAFGNEISNMDNYLKSMNSIIIALKRYIEERNLQGSAYDKIKLIMADYIRVIQKSENIYSDLLSSINDSCQYMINFMENFEVIDDSQKDKIYSQLQSISNNINKCNKAISMLEKKGESIKSESRNLNRFIEQYNYLRRLLAKIEALNMEDTISFKKVDLKANKLSELKNGINSLGVININWDKV